MNILLARIIRGGYERREIGFALSLWTAQAIQMGVGLEVLDVDQEPTPAARNQAVEVAKGREFDVLMMIDGDMIPNLGFFQYVRGIFKGDDMLAKMPENRHHVIGSPYCGGPPNYEVQAMSETAIVGKYERFPRELAAKLSGLDTCPLVGTGLIAIDVRAFDLIKPPYFAYTYSDEKQTLAGTEDFYFCDKLHRAGGRIMMAWDYWSQHSKEIPIGKPE